MTDTQRTPAVEGLVVTQADREAAQSLAGHLPASWWRIGQGLADHEKHVQVMAKHRTYALTAKDAEIAGLRRALSGIRDGDVPRPVAKPWRTDGKWSKNDLCEHGIRMYEECSNCTAAFISQALAANEGERS